MQVEFAVYITTNKSFLTGPVASQIRGRRSQSKDFMQEIG
jgi:hypothetical protein